MQRKCLNQNGMFNMAMHKYKITIYTEDFTLNFLTHEMPVKNGFHVKKNSGADDYAQ